MQDNQNIKMMKDWFPLQYKDTADYCIVEGAKGQAFALTVQPSMIREMERALLEKIEEAKKGKQ